MNARDRMKLTTRQLRNSERVFAFSVLSAVALATNPWDLASWTAVVAVSGTFVHMQVSDHGAKDESTRKALDVTLFLKEVAWVATFVLLGAWPALVGCGLFLGYPLWRRLAVKIEERPPPTPPTPPTPPIRPPVTRAWSIDAVALAVNLVPPDRYRTERARRSPFASYVVGSRSGRTTAMLLEAVTMSLNGHDVRILGHNRAYSYSLVDQAIRMRDLAKSRLWQTPRSGDIRISPPLGQCQGLTSVLFIDHSVRTKRSATQVDL